jgi:ribosomal protein S18 acetylase RimI-like enzyme
MDSIVIREANEEDLPAIIDIYRTAGIGGENNFSADEARAHLSIFRQYPSFRIFVALIDQAVVGTHELLVMDNMAKRGKKEGIVADVAVHPCHQGQGVGRAMIEHAMEECRKADCYKLSLSSNLKREDAHRFYDALGFERHGYSFQVELSKEQG